MNTNKKYFASAPQSITLSIKADNIKAKTKNIKKIVNTRKVDFLPPDVKEVIMNADSVVVTLWDGSKGVAYIDVNDTYDPFVGFCIAHHKANYTKSFRLKEALTGCVTTAAKKGYKNAFLKNYDEVMVNKVEVDEDDEW